MAQIVDSVSRAHGSSHLFAPRRRTLTGQSTQTPVLRFRPRLRRGSFVLTLIRGSLQMGHPWPSAAQSASMPIAPESAPGLSLHPRRDLRCSCHRATKAHQCCCLTGWPDDLCITMSALRGHASRDAPRHKWHRLLIRDLQGSNHRVGKACQCLLPWVDIASNCFS